MKVYLLNFKPNEVKLAEAVTKIGEGLLELAGVTEILDTPFGQRIFTVERMPDNVPMAGIYWERYEPHSRERIAYESLRAGQLDYRGDMVRMEPGRSCGTCDGTKRTARYGRQEEGEPYIVRGDCPNCCPGSCQQAVREERPE